MMKMKGCVALAAVALALLSATVVRASLTVDLNFTGVLPSNTIRLLDDGVGHYVYAGSHRHDVSGPDANWITGAPADDVNMFCLDLVDHAEADSSGFATFELVQARYSPVTATAVHENYPMGETREQYLRVLLDNNSPIGWSPGDSRFTAMQLAVWEVVYEDDNVGGGTGGFSLGTGDFTAYGGNTPSSVITQANQWLAALNLDDFVDEGENHTQYIGALIHPNSTDGDPPPWQDMLVLTNEKVPEPSALALAGLGLLGFFTRRRKRS
jgi:hypothetical protein